MYNIKMTIKSLSCVIVFLAVLSFSFNVFGFCDNSELVASAEVGKSNVYTSILKVGSNVLSKASSIANTLKDNKKTTQNVNTTAKTNNSVNFLSSFTSSIANALKDKKTAQNADTTDKTNNSFNFLTSLTSSIANSLKNNTNSGDILSSFASTLTKVLKADNNTTKKADNNTTKKADNNTTKKADTTVKTNSGSTISADKRFKNAKAYQKDCCTFAKAYYGLPQGCNIRREGTKSSMSNLKVGDLIYSPNFYSGGKQHFMVVTAINGNDITVAEGGIEGKCRTKTLSRDFINSRNPQVYTGYIN